VESDKVSFGGSVAIVSPANTPARKLLAHEFLGSGSLAAPRFLLLALVVTLLAIATDQFAAPILHSTSPLWATLAWLLLVWRSGNRVSASPGEAPGAAISLARLAAFLTAHLVLVLLARSASGAWQAASGAITLQGTLVAALKLCVLVPSLLLFSPATWRKMAAAYLPEAIAGLVVLFTFLPSRALEALWPWYGQLLGRFVHILAGVFVPSLAYLADANPTLSGPQLDVTIVRECSGINGLELFDYLFGIVLLLDWKRLRKGRALIAYFCGIAAMLLGNAIRIASFVVFGNHGFAESVSRFHISAGWVFFSGVFVVFLSLTYRWMLQKEDGDARPQTS
jgi:exosortase/archaeosortase family protein